VWDLPAVGDIATIDLTLDVLGIIPLSVPDGQAVTFGAGDMVRFPAGLSCTWDISAPVKKHFHI
jgi:uncharacterized cupin superfamily protein